MSQAFPSGLYEGLTKREYYAALAMQGDFASQGIEVGCFENDASKNDMIERAKVYFRMADAMIEAAHLTKEP